MDYGGLQESKPKRMKTFKKGNVSIVPSHLSQTDVSDIKGGSSIFLNMMFCILQNFFSVTNFVSLK